MFSNPLIISGILWEDGTIVDVTELGYDEYYDGSHPLVDSNDYRAALGVRRLRGLMIVRES